MNSSPTLNYNGLTVIVSNPSRFDNKNGKLLSSTGGSFFNECLYPHTNRFKCDIRTCERATSSDDGRFVKITKRPLLPNTKCILALGEDAASVWGDKHLSLFEARGNIFFHEECGVKIPVISSFLPQDAIDIKDYESEFNELLHYKFSSNQEENKVIEAVEEKGRHGRTKRKNWAFWLKKDIEKCITLLEYEGDTTKAANSWGSGGLSEYRIYPPLEEVISELGKFKNRLLFFDMETDADLNMLCFSFAWSIDKVFVVPLYRYTYEKAYEELERILVALASSINSNTIVAHNGAGFDFFVLAHKYHISIGRSVYDTMLAQNRIYPEVEKSLGHCISLPWMYETYHKDEGDFRYSTPDQESTLWRYCGKDVSTLIKLHTVQQKYAKTKSGLLDSISDVNSYVRPYLITMLQGIRYDESVVEETFHENDALMSHYIRFLEILIGEENLKTIRGTGKSPMPGSSKQCARYFHEMLNYDVISKTDAGEPKLDAKNLYKLRLKYENPVIDIVLAYRRLSKESGSLKFTPWKTKPKEELVIV